MADTTNLPQSTTAVILAGGQARRMGGKDKGLIEFHGQPMVEHICHALKHQCDAIIINANRNLARYSQFGFPVVSDELDDYQGPLSGMATGLATIETEWMITVPCDGPFVAPDYVKSMHQNRGENHRLSVAFFGDRLQPVYALIHKSLHIDLLDYLKSGERKIDRWYQQHPYHRVDFAHFPDMFININTPEQLKETELTHPG